MKLFRRATEWASVLTMVMVLHGRALGSQWDQPAAALAEQISATLGPGQTALSFRNLSSIAPPDFATIRVLLEQDLRARGIASATGESASAIRITLSQNDRERLWVAEIVQGNETRVVMVRAERDHAGPFAEPSRIVLRKERYVEAAQLLGTQSGSGRDPVLAAMQMQDALLLLGTHGATLLRGSGGAWQLNKRIEFSARIAESRDPRGVITFLADSNTFSAFLPSTECDGTLSSLASSAPDSTQLHCHSSDDPWPILHNDDPERPFMLKAFYNPSRNYFTGVITPGLAPDLPPFYSAALLQRASGPALLIAGIDGKVQLAENGVLRPVSGTRDWGSDIASLRSGCGSGAQAIASSSGEAQSDTLQAYELSGPDTAPASSALDMGGTVTSLSTSADGKSLLATVRQPSGDYEVDRVTALCN